MNSNHPELDRVRVGGLPTNLLSRAELTKLVIQDSLAAQAGQQVRPTLVFDTNGEAISMARTNARFREVLMHADILHADGQSVVNGSRRHAPMAISERSATTDLFHDVAKASAAKGLSFFLLGGEPGLADDCATRMTELHQGLTIAGTQHGYYDDEQTVLKKISDAKPDIIWVGMGKPREQEFCVRNIDILPGGCVITCGGCYNYVTGAYPRAPDWMQRNGLEWLFRLAHDPKRLMWRYAVTSPHALWVMATDSGPDQSGIPR